MRLTGLSKLLILVIVLGAVGAAVYRWRGTLTGPGDKPTTTTAPGEKPRPHAAGKRIVVGVNDFGGAYPGLVANDGALPGPASLFTKAGLDVEIRLVKGSKERLDLFDGGQIDVMLLTLDYLANLYPDYAAKNVEVQAFMMVDWSRGNMGLVTKPEYTTIESLKKARITTTRNTPTHYFLLTLFDRSNLKPNEITAIKDAFVFAKKTPLAGEMFQRGEADAVAIWEPYLSRAVTEAKGRLLVSTATATNLVADVLFARASFLDANADVLPAFVRAWFEGVKKLREDKQGSIALIAKAFSQTPEETAAILGKIKPATFADNRAFFGLETEGSPYATLFAEAAEIWKREGVIKETPSPRKALRTKVLEVVAKEHAGEKVQEDFTFSGQGAKGEALLSKSMSIYFATGSAELDPNARKVVDGFVDRVVGVFQNAYIRVEGNTDNVGGHAANVKLSQRRAQAVVDYLVTRHRFDVARFVAVGNGPDRPVSDNKTAQGREWNRRTDFRVVPNL
jgi:NitT/TauT family transport system substrate-binding protein